MSKTSVLTIRVPKEIDRRLAREARRRRRSRSDVARTILADALAAHPEDDPRAEARRQSLAASASDEDADFATAVADLGGWK
jgi:predicted transcriptional regulator